MKCLKKLCFPKYDIVKYIAEFWPTWDTIHIGFKTTFLIYHSGDVFFFVSAFLITSLGPCTSPLGMEDGRIKDSKIKVSGIRQGTTGYGGQARLNKNIPDWGAWCPDTAGGSRNKLSSDQYIEIDLLALTNFTGIATQGRVYNGAQDYSRRFILSFSKDGITWSHYKEEGARETYNGAKVSVHKYLELN